jgi:hypothetical protein
MRRKHFSKNLHNDEWGFLRPGQYLMHDKDGIFCPAFKKIVDDAGLLKYYDCEAA